HKHRWTWTLKYDRDHFGRRGFKRHPSISRPLVTVNVRDVDRWAKERGVEEIDLTEMGVDKLLGSGKIEKPLRIRVERASPLAIEKVEAAGGSVELSPSEPQGTEASDGTPEAPE
ncbi:MAG: uL15 family ribosomal protein, partial [Thermoplasmata archaeon]|nr:uL15 family ribosomal protein [Thermoplasmata archaeon]